MSEGPSLTPPSPAWLAIQGEPYSKPGLTIRTGKVKRSFFGVGNWRPCFCPFE